MPYERTLAVSRTRDFLNRLSTPYGGGIKGIKKEVRQEARALLKHYPMHHEMVLAGQKVPEVFGNAFADGIVTHVDP